MRDPYDVLGVQRSAKPAAIKSAYRRLAKKLHPDANPNDPKAAGKFAELNTAYEILGDEAKKRAFDAGEIDAEGKPVAPAFEGFGARGPGGGFGGGDSRFETFTWGPGGFQRGGGGAGGAGAGAAGFEEVLKDLFGRAGAGAAGARPGGRRSGFQFEPDDFGPPPGGRDVTVAATISLTEAAKGTSRRVSLPTGKEVEVKIPAGLGDGQQIRLKGQGLPGTGGNGDVLITVHIADDPRFKREGADLRIELPITLYEAVLGGQVRVPTLDGAVSLTIPPGTSSGRVFRLRGKGLPQKSGAGDLFATARIVLPEGSDPALEELMRSWRETKPYDPRSGSQ
ncbi:MAG: J domain-containing protein [Xanthobacteraceae bacterium]|nr:J domain-containing protein [Xanthobacteraceae bacterium]